MSIHRSFSRDFGGRHELTFDACCFAYSLLSSPISYVCVVHLVTFRDRNSHQCIVQVWSTCHLRCLNWIIFGTRKLTGAPALKISPSRVNNFETARSRKKMVPTYSKNYRRCTSHYTPLAGARIGTPSDSENSSLLFESSLTTDGCPLVWRPRYSLTRRTAKITREVQCAWNAVLGPAASVVPAEKITKLFNHLEIYPNNVQVHEMLQCAQKCAGRNSSKYLTFAEFCIFATELKKSIHSRIYRRDYFSKLLRKDEHIKNRKIRKMSDFTSREVFLGGSCNPTTWRRDEAIPILEKYGIPYYNPQVSDWSPELIESEHRAKQNASILLYVIDNQTRNVVSLIETVNFLGSRRKLAIVINFYKGPGQIIASENITADEFNELNSSLVLLKQLVERRKIPVFSDVPEAVNFVVDTFRGSNKKIEEVKNGQRIMKMKEAFESLDTEKCGLICSKDIYKALCLLTQKRSQSAELRKNILQKIDANKTNNHNVKVNFEQFCKIVSELNLTCDKKYLNGNIDKRTNRSNFFRSLSTPDDKPTFTNDNGMLTDIYLGGDCHQGLNWRQKIAIPMIRNSCLTFFNPENERISNQKLSPSEFAVINNSSVLLFVITNSSRALFTMVLASYYIGVGADIVLCIQQLPEQCVIGTDKLSQQAVKDYNRGRLYLADLARRENVPIYESISDAVEAAINKCIK